MSHWNDGMSFKQPVHSLMMIIIWLCVIAYNFSHRIDHLSFGEALPGIISLLDGTEKISADCTSVLSFFVNRFMSFLFI